jgi:hypothetical protein
MDDYSGFIATIRATASIQLTRVPYLGKLYVCVVCKTLLFDSA